MTYSSESGPRANKRGVFKLSFALKQVLILQVFVIVYALFRATLLRFMPATGFALSIAIGIAGIAVWNKDLFATRMTSILITSTVVAAISGIDVAESLRVSYDYWNWKEDWPLLFIWIIAQVLASFAVVVLAFCWRRLRRTSNVDEKDISPPRRGGTLRR